MPAKEGPIAESDSIFERADRSGRVQFCRDVLPELASWFMMMWERQSRAMANALNKDPHQSAEYVRNTVAACSSRMEYIQELIIALPDTWKSDDFSEAMIRVGMMIAAKDEAGNHLTKLGRAMAEAGLINNVTGPGGR